MPDWNVSYGDMRVEGASRGAGVPVKPESPSGRGTSDRERIKTRQKKKDIDCRT